MTITIAKIHREAPSTRELKRLLAKHTARRNLLAARNADTFEIDCAIWDIEAELAAR